MKLFENVSECEQKVGILISKQAIFPSLMLPNFQHRDSCTSTRGENFSLRSIDHVKLKSKSSND
ncbi:CLUMA_CG014646, isoform A [Clunio marinus]|uniref:CLUMA_CG014646, isoform A n=1 Tax=Clunio marinus TaxID=568069 RepID=A0A1J1IMG8_9DIPT|nr:CLUMA_CG014646, isoform A [Clunio marinus]